VKRFQSTYPHGVRRDCRNNPIAGGISIHVPARGTTTGSWQSGARQYYFNPRTRTGYDLLAGRTPYTIRYFNPRTRTGYDIVAPGDQLCRIISIHVPARGTTFCPYPSCHLSLMISIHVPARGTTLRVEQLVELGGISIHVPARGTTIDPLTAMAETDISIHVPARGTTRGILANSPPESNFNPRTRTGYDHPAPAPHPVLPDFNPRTRTGYDLQRLQGRCADHDISIHVPARGTTLS